MTKEPPLKQELGPKKYHEMVEKVNKDYDKYKAGKRDPKTGDYYHPINFNDPRKSKIGKTIPVGYMECKTEGCDEYFRVNRSTRGLICSKCNKFISWTRGEIEELSKS